MPSYPNIDRIVNAMALDAGASHLLKPYDQGVYPPESKIIDDEASTLDDDEISELVGGDYDDVTERWPTLSAFVERLYDGLHDNFYLTAEQRRTPPRQPFPNS
jgi:hypothetical protein